MYYMERFRLYGKVSVICIILRGFCNVYYFVSVMCIVWRSFCNVYYMERFP